MEKLYWQGALAPHILSPRFASYGAFEEKRPVLVDCSLGVNPLDALHPQEPLPVAAAAYAGYPAGGAHGHKALAEYIAGRWPSVSPEEISFGAGSQGAISSLSRILGGPEVLIQGFLPQFIPALLEFATVGARVETFSLPGPDFAPDADLLAGRVREGEGDLYNDLMDVGIQTEPGFFFGLEGTQAVRLRAPSPGDFELFRSQWMRRFS